MFNRRDFLKTAGVAGTVTAAGCYDYKVPYEQIRPYVKQSDDTLPGSSYHFSSTCGECSNACGTVIRSREGRAVSVSGNPDHPHGPGLCTRGHFGLVSTYSPDRLKGPVQGGAEVAWDTALKTVADAITAARSAGKSVAWLGRYRTGSLQLMLDELAAGIGLRRVHWEPLGVETLLAASRAVFGKAAVPNFELAGAHTILSFGMDFLGTAPGVAQMTRGWAAAKDPSDGHVVRFIAVQPRVGATSAQADLWLAPKPGTEVTAALGIAKALADKKGYSGPAAALLGSVSVADAARVSGISEERMNEIAGWLAAGPSVVLPGGSENAGADATSLAIVALVINEIAGNVGTSVVFGREQRFGQVDSYRDARALLDDAAAGKVGVLFLDGIDPVFNIPDGDELAKALDAVDLHVQFANEVDDSTRPKTLMLPPGTTLEGWGDAEALTGVHSLQQPAMTPLFDTKGVGDVLLALGAALVPASPAVDVAAPVDPAAPAAQPRFGFAAKNFADYVRARWAAQVFPTLGGSQSADSLWLVARQKGVLVNPVMAEGASVVLSSLPAPGAGIGEQGKAKALVVFPSTFLADGRHANVPWAQELADPVSTAFWSTWIELHPKTAAELGVSETDTIKIAGPKGEITVGFVIWPGVKEDSVGVVSGNGRQAGGRFAKGRGANPFRLLTPAVDEASGALVTYNARVTLSRGAKASDIHQLIGNINQDGRPLVNVVNAEDALTHTTGEPGSIVSLHHPPVDPRIKSSDMYPEPQHPTYRFAMAVDTNVCNGCMACVVACNTENNIPFVGPSQLTKGRSMSWIRMDRFWEGDWEKTPDHPDVRHMPIMCQQCAHAPCESVCPVLATYHNLDGLNGMIYNRCVGTRYCANNCPYTARRFNYHTFTWPESMHLMLNPDVSTREMGVMEKCTFCVQKLRAAKDTWRDQGHAVVPDLALRKITACAAACPTGAITFGNAKDEAGELRKKWGNTRAYAMLGELNTKPGVRYLARIKHDAPKFVAHGAGHGGGGHDEGGHGGGHGAAPADGHKKETDGAHGATHGEG